MGHSTFDPVDRGPAWDAGRKLGAKRALKPKEIWAIRFMLDQACKVRDRALFDLAIDSKSRGCDLEKVKIGKNLVAGGRVRNRAMVIQQKTRRPVQFELLEPARSTIYKQTGNLRAVQILLGYTKIESTVRYLGVESRMPSRSPKALRFEPSPASRSSDAGDVLYGWQVEVGLSMPARFTSAFARIHLDAR